MAYEHEKTNRTIHTVWEVWTYDVWGNEEDGWEVNDRSCLHREYELDIPIEVFNAGTPHEFESASPTPEQLFELWGVSHDDHQGDDIHLYFEDDDGYPLGQMICISHESLSPPHKAQ